MSIKMLLIMTQIISSFSCLYIIGKYHFDDYVMHHWMDRKNYIVSDLFALLLACTPVLNFFILTFFVTYKFFDTSLVFDPDRRKRFENNTANLVIKFLDESGAKVVYPLVAVIGTCGWIYGFMLASNPWRRLFAVFPGFAWLEILNVFI